MRILAGDQFLVRIFLGESDKWRHMPLARAPSRSACGARLRRSLRRHPAQHGHVHDAATR
jgi:hypothetical protein